MAKVNMEIKSATVKSAQIIYVPQVLRKLTAKIELLLSSCVRVSIPSIYRATCLREFADLGGSEVLRSMRH